MVTRLRTLAPTAFLLPATLAWLLAAPPARAHEYLFFEHVHGGVVHSITLVTNDLGFSAEDGGRMRRWTRNTTSGDWSFEHLDTGYDSRYLLRDVRFGDAQNGWAVGYGGRVVRTNNGGLDWALTATPFLTKPSSSELADLYAVRFVFDTAASVWRGWVVGFEGAIYTSADGGDSWTALTLPAGYAGNDLYGLAVNQTSPGTFQLWVTGDFGTVLRSSNGGASWDLTQSLAPAACSGPNLELWDIEMRSDGLGIIAGGVGTGCGESFYTLNHGVSWTPQTCFSSGGLSSPHDLWNTAYGVALGGSFGAVTCGYASQANALTSAPLCWTQTTDPSLSYLGHPPTFGIAAKDGQVLQSGMFNVVRASNDGGLTWVNEGDTHYMRERDAAFVDEQLGCIVGQGHRILRTSDGMQTFTQVHIGPNLGPSMNGVAVSPVTSRHWLAVGDHESGYPYVARSTSHGVSWARTASSAFTGLGAGTLLELALHPTTTQRALVVGANGTVLNTTDLGLTFASWNSGISGAPELRSIAFTSAGDAFVVGSPAGGFSAWRSAGAANAWVGVPLKDASGTTLTNVQLNAVASGAGLVWAVGDDGFAFEYDAASGELRQQVPTTPGYDPLEDFVGVTLHATASETHVVIGGEDGGVRYVNETNGFWTNPRSRISQTGDGHGARLSAIQVFPMPGNADAFRGYVFGRQIQVSRFVSPGASF